MRRCVIIGGAPIRDYSRSRAYLSPGDFCVYCDGGLAHQAGLGRTPDLIVGDFDSHAPPPPGPETIVLPTEKDETDTAFALRECLRRGYRDFLLLGAAGGRLDHTLANVSLLSRLQQAGCRGLLVDDYGEMELLDARGAEISDRFAFYSLIALSGTARGVTQTGCRYPQREAEILFSRQYATGNQVLPGQTARVSVREGTVLLMRIFSGDT